MFRSAVSRLFGRWNLLSPLLAVAIVVSFGYLTELSWAQTATICGISLTAGADGIGQELPVGDERHARLLFGALIAVASLFVFQSGTDRTVAIGTAAVGVWLVIDAIYSLHSGVRVSNSDDQELSSEEARFRIQVGHRVVDELKDGPRTVTELAVACDMTESRVRDALELAEAGGVVSQTGQQWQLAAANMGAIAFVRINSRLLLARILRPFRLFVPS